MRNVIKTTLFFSIYSSIFLIFFLILTDYKPVKILSNGNKIEFKLVCDKLKDPKWQFLNNFVFPLLLKKKIKPDWSFFYNWSSTMENMSIYSYLSKLIFFLNSFICIQYQSKECFKF